MEQIIEKDIRQSKDYQIMLRFLTETKEGIKLANKIRN